MQSSADLYAQAETLEHSDEVGEALLVTERALDTARSSGDAYWYWKFRLKKVEILLSHSRTTEASRLFEPSELPLPKNAEIRILFATQKGGLCLRTRDYKCAVDHLLEAETLANSVHYESLLPIIEMKLGNALVASDQTTAAEEHFRKAARMVTAHADPYTRLSVQGALGYLLIQQQRYDEAIQVYEQAFDAGKTSGLRMIQASNVLNLGYCYSQVGDTDRAEPLLDRASRLFTDLQRLDGMQLVLLNLGETALARRDPEAAESIFERSASLAKLAKDDVWLANSLTGMATVALERKDNRAAQGLQARVAALVKQKQIREPDLALAMRINEGRIAQASGDARGAQEQFRAAAAMYAVDRRLALEAQTRLAESLADSAKSIGAEAAFRKAVQRFDASRSRLSREESKLSYDSALISLFQQYVEFLAARGRYAEAFELAESSRARLLVEQTSPAPKVSIDVFRAFAARAKSTLLFYWTGPRRSWLWMITASGITPVELPADASLRALATSYRQEIERLRDPLQSFGSAGWRLSAALLDPVRAALKSNAHLLVVPDGPIFDINLAALPVDRTRPHYFIEEAEVTIVPSLSLLLARGAEARNRKENILAFGDIVSPNKVNYPDLANAGLELQSLAALFPGAVTMRTQSDAVPRAYREARPIQYSMIHFATHAEANYDDPLDSAVILSKQGDIFKLSAREIQKEPITANLVTVSSCRSAGSRIYAGEGLVGFAWAFLAAGARHVIAGLWNADDRSTALLMKNMYASLKRGACPGDALREAQRGLLKSTGPYRKPYYWGQFEVFADSIH